MTEKKGGCCKDEHKSFQLKTEHQKTAIAQFVFPSAEPTVIDTSYMDVYSAACYSLVTNFPACHAPPDIGQQKLFILYRVFRI